MKLTYCSLSLRACQLETDCNLVHEELATKAKWLVRKQKRKKIKFWNFGLVKLKIFDYISLILFLIGINLLLQCTLLSTSKEIELTTQLELFQTYDAEKKIQQGSP